VYELKHVLKTNGLSVAGSKQDLIRRLAVFEQSGVANRNDPSTPPPNGYWTAIGEGKNSYISYIYIEIAYIAYIAYTANTRCTLFHETLRPSSC
jgi:hypothetical protein